MSRRLLSLSAIAVLGLMILPAWANNNSKDSIKTTIDITSTSKVSGTTLRPGQYTVVAEGNQAKFERDGKVVAEVPCTVKTLSTKSPNNQLVMDHGQITEIDLSGKTQAIELPSNSSAGN